MVTTLTAPNNDTPPRRRSIGLDRSTPLATLESLPANNLAVALALARSGLHIIPAKVVYNERDRRWDKRPLITGWPALASTDPETIRRWWSQWPKALPGIACGKSGVLVADPDRHGGPDGVKAWDGLTGGRNTTPAYVETAGGGFHFYFSASGHGNGEGRLPKGINIRGVGGFVIAPGAIRPDGTRWLPAGGLEAFLATVKDGLPPVPSWLGDLLGPVPKERKPLPPLDRDPTDQEKDRALATLKKKCRELESAEAGGRTSALMAAGFIAGGCIRISAIEDEEEAWGLIEDSAAGYIDAYGEREFERQFSNALDNGQTFCDMQLPEIEMEDERPRDADGRPIERREQKLSRPKMQLQDIEDAAALALTRTREPLIDGLLDERAMSVVYGPSNVGKTFVMLDMAIAVATGSPWNGMDTTRALVVYVAAEGGFGVNQRLLALLRKYEREAGKGGPKPLLALVKYPIDLRTNEADADELCRLITAEEILRGVNCAWVIVDTLSRAMSGGDENNSVDMGLIVKAADRIREKTGAHFTFVHHTGKDVAKGARGHSSLRAATDTELEVNDGKLSVEKQRDMQISGELSFLLKPVELGKDPRGRPVTSATVEWGRAGTDSPTSKLNEGEAAYVHAVESALADHGARKIIDGRHVRAVDREQVREKFYAAWSADTTKDVKRSAFNRNKKSKAVTAIVSSHDDGITVWFYIKRDFIGLTMQDESAAQDELGAFGKRSSGQP